MTNNSKLTVKDSKILFVSSSGKNIKTIPFIESQYESIRPFVKKIEHYRVESGGIRAYIFAYKELKKKLRNESFDIIHAHWVYSGILSLNLIKKEKLIISFMGNDLMGIYSNNYNILTIKGLINILLSQFLLFKANAVIVKSKSMTHWIPSFFHYKTEIIPNGVNLDRFKALEQSVAREYLKLDVKQKYIVFLGDIEDGRKNFALLKKAGKYLDKDNVNYKILTPYPANPIHVPFYLAAADVLAFPSKLEGSPNIIKEAIAVGCPIVATDVGDIKERIGSIEGCYISKFDEYDFAQKLTAVLNRNKRINSSGHLAEISEITIAKRIITLYQECLNTTNHIKS